MPLEYADMADELFDVERAAPDGGSEPRTDRGAIVLRLYVQPGAGRGAVTGRRGDALHVRVAPPPVDGRANDAVVELIADVLHVARSRIELVGGERSRQKRLRVSDVDPEEVRRLLDEAVTEAGGGRTGRERGAHRRR